jgi:hypothetical protein
VRPTFHIRSFPVLWIRLEVTDYISTGIGSDVRGVDCQISCVVGEDAHSVRTHTPGNVKLLGAQIDLVAWTAYLGVQQGNGFGSFGDDVLVIAIDERNERAIRVHTNGAKLGEGGQYAVWRDLGLNASSSCLWNQAD